MAYIDRDKLAERIKLSPAFKKFHRGFESELLQNVVLDLIDNIPTADVVEVKHGEWSHKLDCNGYTCYECSECKTLHKYSTDYCPNCGSKMEKRDFSNF